MQVTELDVMRSVVEHSPFEVWNNDEREGYEDWRIECTCSPTEFTREDYARHVAAAVAGRAR